MSVREEYRVVSEEGFPIAAPRKTLKEARALAAWHGFSVCIEHRVIETITSPWKHVERTGEH